IAADGNAVGRPRRHARTGVGLVRAAQRQRIIPAGDAVSAESGAAVAIGDVSKAHCCATVAMRSIALTHENGRASCRERVCAYGSISVVAASLKKKTKSN